MKKVWIIIIVIIIILITLVVYQFIKSSGPCITVLSYGENVLTGKCSTFSTPCKMPFWYRSSEVCKFIIIERQLLDKEESIRRCNSFDNNDKEKIFNKLNINSCEELTKM